MPQYSTILFPYNLTMHLTTSCRQFNEDYDKLLLT